MIFSGLRNDQDRQMAELGQAFAVLEDGLRSLEHYRGTMRWKTIKGNEYLYRRSGVKDVSLGRRSPETEQVKHAFDQGKGAATEVVEAARRKIEQMAPVNRAMGLGRVPLLAARIARKLDGVGLLGRNLTIVGSNSLYCYEAMAGGHFDTGLTSTDDMDFLFDSRKRIQIMADEESQRSLVNLIKSVDQSFKTLPGGYRMANKENYLVDLIAPAAKDAVRAKPQKASADTDDLVAVEVEGLQWLINAPRVSAMAVDMRGLPVRLNCIDPRFYALHKLWLSEQPNREAPRRRRDRAQAEAVAQLVQEHLQHLSFEAEEMQAMPKRLRDRAAELLKPEEQGHSPW